MKEIYNKLLIKLPQEWAFENFCIPVTLSKGDFYLGFNGRNFLIMRYDNKIPSAELWIKLKNLKEDVVEREVVLEPTVEL